MKRFNTLGYIALLLLALGLASCSNKLDNTDTMVSDTISHNATQPNVTLTTPTPPTAVPPEDVIPETSQPPAQEEIEAAHPTAAQSSKEDDRKDYSSDAVLAVTEIEDAHPIFMLDELPEHYDSVREDYLAYTAKPLTKTEFLLATQKYLTILSDGHMGGGLIEKGLYINVNWIVEDSKLYITDEKGRPSDREVIQIGGVPTGEVMEQVDIYYFAENDSARRLRYAAYCRQEEMLSLAGCRYNDNSIILTLESNGTTSTMECKITTKNTWTIHNYMRRRYIVKHRMIGDVFYIDLREFSHDKSIYDTVIAIQNATKDGTKKFIIDVRDNGGGNSAIGEMLLNAMGMFVPDYGVYIRFNHLAKEQRGGSGDDELVYYEPNLNTAQNNSDVSLAILTNERTFSSATMLGVWVQDGELGTIIGRASSNSPTCYGDMLSIRLPLSGIDLPISCKKFLRPNTLADPTTLHPDILTVPGENALDTALDYFSK